MGKDGLEQTLFQAARRDGRYQQALRACREAEEAYRKVLPGLPPEQQEIIEDYIAASMELEHRMVQLALELPKE